MVHADVGNEHVVLVGNQVARDQRSALSIHGQSVFVLAETQRRSNLENQTIDLFVLLVDPRDTRSLSNTG